MNEKTLYTISEYAEYAGISKQRVYQLLQKRLKPCLVIIDGVKMIDLSKTDTSDTDTARSDETHTEIKQAPAGDQISSNDLLQQTINILQDQLKAKDLQIQQLTEALTTAQKQVEQAQVLHGVSLRLLSGSEAPAEANADDRNNSNDTIINEDISIAHSQPAEEAPAEKKQSLLRRLFKRT